MPELAASSSATVLRILDANQNRSREALRTIEEYLRFGLNDSHLAELTKQLRHSLQTAMTRVPPQQLLACRDTTGDVGTRISLASEGERTDVQSVVAAAFSRLQESLRSIEEYGKTLDPTLGEMVQHIRYDSYTLEKAVACTRNAVERLQGCQLYVLLEALSSKAAFAQQARQLIAAGVDAIQLRDKRATDRILLARALQLRSLTTGTATLFILNDRPDLALLSQADGVHVGQEELSVADVRRVVGADMLIGVSTHTIEQARTAVLAGANYLGVGPVFPSSTKQFEHFPGLEFVQQVAAEIQLPAFAIGGIHAGNIEQVVANGLRRVAISGALTTCDDLNSTVEDLRACLSA